MDPPSTDPHASGEPQGPAPSDGQLEADDLQRPHEWQQEPVAPGASPDRLIGAPMPTAAWARWFDGLDTADQVLRAARKARLDQALVQGEVAAARESLGMSDEALRLDDRALITRWVMAYYLNGPGAALYDLFAVLMVLRLAPRRTLSEITQQRWESAGCSTAGEREVIRKRVRAVFSRAMRNRFVIVERVSERQTFFSLSALGQMAMAGHLNARVGYALLEPHLPIALVCEDVAEDEFPILVRDEMALPTPAKALALQTKTNQPAAQLTQFFNKIVATRSSTLDGVEDSGDSARAERTAQLRESQKATNRQRSSRWQDTSDATKMARARERAAPPRSGSASRRSK